MSICSQPGHTWYSRCTEPCPMCLRELWGTCGTDPDCPEGSTHTGVQPCKNQMGWVEKLTKSASLSAKSVAFPRKAPCLEQVSLVPRTLRASISTKTLFKGDGLALSGPPAGGSSPTLTQNPGQNLGTEPRGVGCSLVAPGSQGLASLSLAQDTCLGIRVTPLLLHLLGKPIMAPGPPPPPRSCLNVHIHGKGAGEGDLSRKPQPMPTPAKLRSRAPAGQAADTPKSG